MRKISKDMIFVAKVFTLSVDGAWDFNLPKKKTWKYNHLSPQCARYKLEKRIEAKIGYRPGIIGRETILSEDKYMVITSAKNESALLYGLIDEGFFEVKFKNVEPA